MARNVKIDVFILIGLVFKRNWQKFILKKNPRTSRDFIVIFKIILSFQNYFQMLEKQTFPDQFQGSRQPLSTELLVLP